MSDVFADLFRALRVRGVVYFARDFASPWGMALPERPYVQFHVALAGSFRVEWAGGSLLVSEREVVLFPNGTRHAVSDGGDTPLRDGREVVQAIRRGECPFPGDTADVRLLSGHFEFDRAARHPLLHGLPDLVHVGAPDASEAPLHRALEPLVAAETISRRPGAETILERVVEIGLVQALRSHLAGRRAAPGTLLGALFDERLAAAVALIHARWAEPLSLRDLARAAGMSRSSFAAAFAARAGITPMAYLGRRRLLKGRELLSHRGMSVAQVAMACGHKSTEGFSRAFSRLYGQSPSAMRAASVGDAVARRATVPVTAAPLPGARAWEGTSPDPG